MVKRFGLSLVASALLLSTAAFAQGAPEPAPAAPPAIVHGGAGPLAHRLQAAHDRLGITAAQQPQWDALVATVRENAQAMRANQAVQSMRSAQVTGVQLVRAAAGAAQQRAEAMQRMVPVVEGLYAVLTPEQRQMADQDIERLMRPGRHHG